MRIFAKASLLEKRLEFAYEKFIFWNDLSNVHKLVNNFLQLFELIYHIPSFSWMLIRLFFKKKQQTQVFISS
jgi:hypothetical protein